MNLARYLTGCGRALGPSKDWPKFFNLTQTGFIESFAAIGLSVPCYYVGAIAIQTRRAEMISVEMLSDSVNRPSLLFIPIILFYTLVFSACAYIFAAVFSKMPQWQAWVVVRHWTTFFMAFFAALLMGFYMVGVLPFGVANVGVFGLYLGTLFVDIRLAQKIAGFEWGAAVLAACIITAMGLTALLIGVAQFVEA